MSTLDIYQDIEVLRSTQSSLQKNTSFDVIPILDTAHYTILLGLYSPWDVSLLTSVQRKLIYGPRQNLFRIIC